METGTHRAIVECSFPPSIELVASGPQRWCVDRLVEWTEKHPTPQWSRAYVVAVTDEVICEPGVGVYSVSSSRPVVSAARAQDEPEMPDEAAVEVAMQAVLDAMPLSWAEQDPGFAGTAARNIARAVLTALSGRSDDA